MFAAVDWSNLGYAGAFIVGAIVGGFAVLRLTKNVLEYLRGERRNDDN